MPAKSERGSPSALTSLIEECRQLINAAGTGLESQCAALAAPLPSLLEQCSSITREPESAGEPVRIVSHFACTGGTLIAKCIASMPNTVVLSEVAPHSDVTLRTGTRFFPTDLIQLARTGGYPVSEGLVSEIFHSGLKVIHEDTCRRGMRLVLREHAHSKYCVGDDVVAVPSLADEVQSVFPAHVIVTVRHPLDSFLSLINNDWIHFQPFTVEEYCRRYLQYLDEHAQYALFSYEEFTQDPITQARRMCRELRLPFNEGFMDLFAIQRMSGDSGRSSGVIGKRPRRPVPAEVESQLDRSQSYRVLCQRLGYPCAAGNL